MRDGVRDAALAQEIGPRRGAAFSRRVVGCAAFSRHNGYLHVHVIFCAIFNLCDVIFIFGFFLALFGSLFCAHNE